MKNIIVLHDAFTNPTEYWYPQITSLAPAGYSVVTPELPTGAEQGMEYWVNHLQQYNNLINADTIIISHGISSLLTLSWLKTFTQPIRNYISIAGCAEAPAHLALAPIAESFLKNPFDWNLLKTKTSSVIHIWNAQDPFVEPQKSKQFAELMPGQVKTLTGSGHFTDFNEIELLTELQNVFQQIQKTDEHNQALKTLEAEQQQKENQAKAAIPSTVTYDTDVAQSIAGYQGKIISELLSEARLRESEEKEVSVKNPKNIFYIIGTIILITASIGGLIYGVIPLLPTVVQLVESPTKKYETNLLRVETIKPFELNGVQDYQLKEQLRAVQVGEISEKTFSSIVPTQSGEKTSLATFVSTFDMKFPVGFADKADEYVYGYYHPVGKEKVPFLLVQFQGYDVMYSIMRTWESTLIDGTITLFAPDQLVSNLLKSETPSFKDIIVNNIPLRTATLSSGYTVTYGFLTDQTLLITTSTDIAEPVLRRMIGR
ncbi:MAG TPA: alpha/beta hydrolase [Candidatus Paceibacterota bacterium]|jgi:predicted alpha/beta hydrolase family esterase|nr:alpha/beta hydrolase [Candidatus Paceibacterota bacterium]